MTSCPFSRKRLPTFLARISVPPISDGGKPLITKRTLIVLGPECASSLFSDSLILLAALQVKLDVFRDPIAVTEQIRTEDG